jgi:hypothetical protein
VRVLTRSETPVITDPVAETPVGASAPAAG